MSMQKGKQQIVTRKKLWISCYGLRFQYETFYCSSLANMCFSIGCKTIAIYYVSIKKELLKNL